MRTRAIRSAAGALVLTAGCRAPRAGRPVPPPGVPLALSSESSEYAPVLRVAARVRVAADSVVVALDSGFVLSPGQRAPGLPAVMRALRFTAILAAPRPPGASQAGAPGTAAGRNAWVVLAEGAPRPLADSLYVGVPHPLAPGRVAVARPPGLDPRRAFLMFRIEGDAVEIGRAGPAGGVRAGRVLRGGVRVYACAAANLDGGPDAGRTAALAAAYTAAC